MTFLFIPWRDGSSLISIGSTVDISNTIMIFVQIKRMKHHENLCDENVYNECLGLDLCT